MTEGPSNNNTNLLAVTGVTSHTGTQKGQRSAQISVITDVSNLLDSVW